LSLLGIDIGSSGCKAAAFDNNGNILGKSIVEYWPETEGVYSEINPEIFWQSVVKAVRNVSAKAGKDIIEALAVSSQGETFICVDGSGNCVGPAIMNADNRAHDEVSIVKKEIGDKDIYSITGAPLHPMFPLSKILWLRRNKPDIYKKTRYFLSVGDYILFRMGFGPVSDYSLSSRMQLFDINKKRWSGELLDLIGLSEKQLPETYSAGHVVGELTNEISEVLGLKRGTIVGLGGHDQPCGCLGSGAVGSGEIVDSAGTYECLGISSHTPFMTEEARKYSLNSYCHVIKDSYITLAFSPGSIMVKWFLDKFFECEIKTAGFSKDKIKMDLDKRVSNGPTGICITPHIIGSINPNWDPDASTVICGITLNAGREDIYKAIYEGITFELGLNIKVLESLSKGFKFINITGGGSTADKWVKLRADINGKTFRTLENIESVCGGCAILAGIASGIFKGEEDAAGRFVRVKDQYVPDHKVYSLYERQRKQYECLYDSLSPYRSYQYI
jgi:xylulokinase